MALERSLSWTKLSRSANAYGNNLAHMGALTEAVNAWAGEADDGWWCEVNWGEVVHSQVCAMLEGLADLDSVQSPGTQPPQSRMLKRLVSKGLCWTLQACATHSHGPCMSSREDYVFMCVLLTFQEVHIGSVKLYVHLFSNTDTV